jgi:hypothetical protein
MSAQGGEAWSNPKNKIECPDNCGAFGTPTKPFSDGTQHVKGCAKSGCKKCVGRLWKRKGGKDQREGKKELAILSASSLHTGHEEDDSEPWENKAGARFTGPAFTAWELAEGQYENNRPIGRGPLLFLRMTHPKRKHSLIVIRGDRLYEAWLRIGINHKWIDEGAA